jgi:hypothetical protein
MTGNYPSHGPFLPDYNLDFNGLTHNNKRNFYEKDNLLPVPPLHSNPFMELQKIAA